MKLKNILMTAAIALVGVASANAALTYTAGNLIIGFNNGTTELVYQLGPYTNFVLGQTYSKDISSDLSTAFGTGWNTATNISWGVIGVTTSTSTTKLVLGLGEVTKGTQVDAPTLATSAESVNTKNALFNLGSYLSTYSDGNTKSPTAITNGVINNPTDTSSAFFTNEALGTSTGINGNSFNAVDPATFEATGSTLNTSAVDLFKFASASSGAAGTYQGTFAISNGTLSFSSVPEPSTYAMMGIGAIGFLTMFRRRSIKA